MSLSNFVKRVRNIMRNDAGINGDAQRIEQMAWMLFLKVYDEKENDWELDDDDYKSIIPEECRWRNWAHDDGSGNALTGDELLSFVNNTLFVELKNIEVTPTTPIRQAIVKTTFEDANQYMKDGVQLRQVLNVIDGLNLGDYEESHAFGEIYETILKEMQSAGSSGEFYTPRALTEFMAEIVNPQIGEKMADFACGTGGFITSWLGELDKKVKTAEDRKEYNQSVFGIEKKQFPYMLCVTNLLLHGIDTPLVYHDNSLTKDVLNYTDGDKFDVVLMNPPYGGNEKSDVKSHFPSDMRSSETVVHGSHHVPTEEEWSCSGHCPRRFSVWSGQHKDSHQDQATQRFQLAYHYPFARQYLCTLHFDCHEHFVLRQYQCGGCSRRLFYKGNVVLSFGYARGLQAFLQDKIYEVGTLRPNP